MMAKEKEEACHLVTANDFISFRNIKVTQLWWNVFYIYDNDKEQANYPIETTIWSKWDSPVQRGGKEFPGISSVEVLS